MSEKVNLKLWVVGARPRTLLLAIAPVLLGFSATFSTDFQAELGKVALALVVALLLQIGVNYANDYSDGIRGTDANRKGPLRLTASGSARPKAVRNAAFLSLGTAALAGLALVIWIQEWWLLIVGAAAILSAWLYTGGKRPFGYFGLGELVAFVFFGLVATAGTSYVATGHFIELSLPLGAAAGSFAAAVLLINNIRDLESDKKSGKRTLAVLLGRQFGRALFLVLIWAPMLLVLLLSNLFPAVALGWATLLLVIPSTVVVGYAKSAEEYNLVLKLTAFASLAFSLLVSLGLVLPSI